MPPVRTTPRKDRDKTNTKVKAEEARGEAKGKGKIRKEPIVEVEDVSNNST